MEKKLINKLKEIFKKNQIPYLEIEKSNNIQNQIDIKVYFPKIAINICKFLDKKFTILNKKEVMLKKNKYGYHEIILIINFKNELYRLKISSILKNTWGIANKY